MNLAEGYIGQKKKTFAEDPWERVYRAKESGAVLQGRVTGIERNASGPELLVDLGSVLGVIPASEAGPVPQDRVESLLGSVVAFKVIACDREKGRAFLSRKAALEEMASSTWEELSSAFASLDGQDPRAFGPVRTCVVRHVGKGGAIVDIGGVQARLPARELVPGFSGDARDLVEPGDCFDVRVVSLDPETRSAVVSAAALLPDPWESASARYPKGSVHVAKVLKRLPRGAICELEPGVNAFVPLEPAHEVPEGARCLVRVTKLDPSRRRALGVWLREVRGWRV